MAKRKNTRQKRSNQTSNHPSKATVKADQEVPAQQDVKEPGAKVAEPTETIEASPEPLKDAESKESAEETSEIKEPQFLDKFWFGNVFVPGVGVVNGRVRDDHLEKFKNKFEMGQAGLPKADRLELKIDYWVRDKDELDKKLSEGKKVKT